ncbi:MAG: hypothetical protein H0W86_06475 [Armatimonadetes bacterium]|nr:hypothetical protein [Armatimonadota bacterium]
MAPEPLSSKVTRPAAEPQVELDQGIPSAEPSTISATDWGTFKNSVRLSEQERLWVEYEIGGS